MGFYCDYFNSFRGGIFTASMMWWSTPSMSRYLLFYKNPTEPYETIEVLHHHGFVYNFNAMYHIIEIPKVGMYLQKKIEHRNLSGRWVIAEDNPYFDDVGEVVLQEGEVKSDSINP